MNKSEQPKHPQDEDTTLLHLNSFAHGAPLPPEIPVTSEPGTTLIRRAAVEAVSETAKPVVVPASAAPLTADEMLGAVAYCYIKGVFSSEDIEGKMLQDPGFREALNGVVPDRTSIRKFRRLNREAIQSVLEKFYARLRHQQNPVSGISPGHSSSPAMSFPNADRPKQEENTAVFTRRVALERLDKATFIDGMSDF